MSDINALVDGTKYCILSQLSLLLQYKNRQQGYP